MSQVSGLMGVLTSCDAAGAFGLLSGIGVVVRVEDARTGDDIALILHVCVASAILLRGLGTWSTRARPLRCGARSLTYAR